MTAGTRNKLIAATVVTAVVVVLALQNTETVETKLLFATVSMPRAMLLFATFLVGVGCGFLLALAQARRKKK